jgi:predicted enzyme related to lactoylglutathione lyase
MENKIIGIGQVAITVSDIATALPFYRDVLGLQFLFSPAPTLAFLAAGTVRIMLSTPQGAGAVGANSVLYFKTQDIETSFAAIVARGALAERAPQFAAPMQEHNLWIGFVRDPDGNLVGLMEEKAK